MDIEDIESTLDSLKRLYGLLRKDGDTSLAVSKALDDKSRLLLKGLLDMVAKKVFKACPEVGSSSAQCSTQWLQLGDEWKQLPPALHNQSEVSPLIQYSGNDQDNYNHKCTNTGSQEAPTTQPILGVPASPFGNGNKSCRICKRRISRKSSLHHLNSQIENGLEAWRRLEKVNQGLDGLDQAAMRSLGFSLNRQATSPMRSRDESKAIDSLSEEAFDVIKQIELCIQNLNIGSGSSGLYASTSGPMDGIHQNDLSDKVSNFVSQLESCIPVVETKFPVATGIELGQIGHSDADSEVPCKTMSQHMEMKLSNQNYIQSLKPLPPENSMMGPGSRSRISTQREGPLHGDEALNQSVDWVLGQKVKSIVAKIESLNQDSQNDLMPSRAYFNCSSSNSYLISENNPALNDLIPMEKYNLKYLTPNEYMNRERVPALITWLANQISKENLQEKQSILNDIFKRPRAYHQPSGMPRVPVDDLLSDEDIRTDDTNGCKVNRTSKAQGKRNLSSQVFKGHHPKRKDIINPPKTISNHKHEYDDKSLNSNRRSQQASTSDYEGEEYDVPSWRHRQTLGSASDSSNSDVYSLRHRHQWQHTDTSSESKSMGHSAAQKIRNVDASSSLDEYSSATSDRDYEVTSFSSNESAESGEYSLPSSATTDSWRKRSVHGPPRFEHYKQPRRYSQMDLTSERTGSTRFRKKRVGTWKKLKDKLSIIFHHHHHHHHHHHRDPDDDGRDAGNHESRISQGKYISEKTPPPVGKPILNTVNHKHKNHNFTGLLSGLFGHIRNSKRKPKISGKNIKLLGKGHPEGTKDWKKQQWRQILQRQKKLKNLGIGYKEKTTLRFSKKSEVD